MKNLILATILRTETGMPLSRQTVIEIVLKLQNSVNQTHTLKKSAERQNQPSKQKMFVYVTTASFFRTRLIRTPHYFNLESISLQAISSYLLAAIMSPCYFELFFVSLGGSK